MKKTKILVSFFLACTHMYGSEVALTKEIKEKGRIRSFIEMYGSNGSTDKTREDLSDKYILIINDYQQDFDNEAQLVEDLRRIFEGHISPEKVMICCTYTNPLNKAKHAFFVTRNMLDGLRADSVEIYKGTGWTITPEQEAEYGVGSITERAKEYEERQYPNKPIRIFDRFHATLNAVTADKATTAELSYASMKICDAGLKAVYGQGTESVDDRNIRPFENLNAKLLSLSKGSVVLVHDAPLHDLRIISDEALEIIGMIYSQGGWYQRPNADGSMGAKTIGYNEIAVDQNERLKGIPKRLIPSTLCDQFKNTISPVVYSVLLNCFEEFDLSPEVKASWINGLTWQYYMNFRGQERLEEYDLPKIVDNLNRNLAKEGGLVVTIPHDLVATAIRHAEMYPGYGADLSSLYTYKPWIFETNSEARGPYMGPGSNPESFIKKCHAPTEAVLSTAVILTERDSAPSLKKRRSSELDHVIDLAEPTSTLLDDGLAGTRLLLDYLFYNNDKGRAIFNARLDQVMQATHS